MKSTVRVDAFKCARCNHVWLPRGEGRPVRCAKCKSPYWDRPAKGKKSR